MLQDIEPYQFYNEFNIKEPKDFDYILLYHENQVALEIITEENVRIPTYAFLKKQISGIENNLTYLFAVDGVSFFMVGRMEGITQIEPALRLYPVQIFRDFDPKWLGFAGITGSQLHRWYQNHQYCGHCGHSLVKSTKERAMVCEQCGVIEYPKISPAVIVGVMDGDKILMTKYANRSFKRYALLAGFVEVGETLEQTVHREVMEEVGIKVKRVRYFDNQPWSFSDSLLIGFFADLEGDNKITLDTEELAEAQWFSREEMPIDNENDISLTYAMMKAFREGNV